MWPGWTSSSHPSGPRTGRPAPRRSDGGEDRAMSKVKVAIAGVGNCANSLIQGVTYYADADPGARVPGLMHVELGGYHVRDIEFVAAFDVDAAKGGVGRSTA